MPRNSTVVRVLNNSGSNRDKLDILGIDGPLFTPTESVSGFQREPAFTCVTPTADHAGRFVILAEPIPDGKIGRACISGAVPVKVYVNDEDDGFADVKASDATQLDSSTSGTAKILWKESGTGQVYAVVRLADVTLFKVEFGKPTAAFAGGATITLDPCDEDGDDNGQANVTLDCTVDRSYVSATFATSDVLAFVRYPALHGSVCGVLLGLRPNGIIERGKPTGTFYSGSTITLNPVDAAGTDNGLADITVYLARDKSSQVVRYAATDILSFIRFEASDGTASGLLVGESPLPWTTTGDIVYLDYSDGNPDPARLAIGTEDQVLTVGSGGVPAWVDPANVAGISIYRFIYHLDNEVGGVPDVNGFYEYEVTLNSTKDWRNFIGAGSMVVDETPGDMTTSIPNTSAYDRTTHDLILARPGMGVDQSIFGVNFDTGWSGVTYISVIVKSTGNLALRVKQKTDPQECAVWIQMTAFTSMDCPSSGYTEYGSEH